MKTIEISGIEVVLNWTGPLIKTHDEETFDKISNYLFHEGFVGKDQMVTYFE